MRNGRIATQTRVRRQEGGCATHEGTNDETRGREQLVITLDIAHGEFVSRLVWDAHCRHTLTSTLTSTVYKLAASLPH